MRALTIGWMALLLAACTPAARGTFVIVGLDTASPVPPGIRTIVLDLELSGQMATTEITSDADITLPTSASLEIGEGEGELAVNAIAQTEGGLWLGSAAGRVLLVKDATASLDLHLSFTGKPAVDGGVADGAVADGPVAPQLAFDTDSPFDFGVVAIGGPGGFATFRLRNFGSTTAMPLAPLVSGGSAWFSVTTDQCAGATLAPFQTCTITVNVQPKSASTESATLEVAGSPGMAASLSLKATGVASGALALSPDPIEAGAVRVGTGQSDVVVTVTNTGDQITSAPLGVSITGSDGPHFSIASGGTCPAGQALAAHAMCTIVVRFAPTSAGPKSATLFVSAGADGGGVAALHGVGTTPAKLTLDQPTQYYFGTQPLYSNESMPITLTNTGSEEAGPLLDWALADSDQFTASGCAPGTRLAGGSSCTIWVVFAPTVRGLHQATITLGAEPGGTVTATIAGIGEEVVTLSVTKSGTGKVLSDPPGDIVCDEASTKCTAVYTISTTVPTVSLTGIATSPATFLGWSGASCTGTGTCVLTMNQSHQVEATFAPAIAVTVSLAGTGIGSVAVEPGGHVCASSCSLTLPRSGNPVQITATPLNGTDSVLSHWSGDCAGNGANRFCSQSGQGDIAVTAHFDHVAANLVFVTSTTITGDLGSAAEYQARCNTLATKAGINNASNDGYVTWMAASDYSPLALLAGSRGWVRTDLRPWIDNPADAFVAASQLYPPALDENGQRVEAFLYTGMSAAGAVDSNNCGDWSDLDGFASSRYTHSSEHFSSYDCSAFLRHLCLRRGASTPISVSAASGKRIYLSNTPFLPGGGLAAADAKCVADAPSGVVNAKALLVATTRSFSELIDPVTAYVRPDGVAIGNGASILEAFATSYPGPALEASISVAGNGSYQGVLDPSTGGVWSGMGPPGVVGENCNDWKSASAGLLGTIGKSAGWIVTGYGGGNYCNKTFYHLRCVEQ